MGCGVYSAHKTGHGFPDLVISDPQTQITYLAEVKDGTKWICRQKLNLAQQKFHDAWKAPIAILTSVDDAIAWVESIRKNKGMTNATI
jgi:hypothetical protein